MQNWLQKTTQTSYCVCVCVCACGPDYYVCDWLFVSKISLAAQRKTSNLSLLQISCPFLLTPTLPNNRRNTFVVKSLQQKVVMCVEMWTTNEKTVPRKSKRLRRWRQGKTESGKPCRVRARKGRRRGRWSCNFRFIVEWIVELISVFCLLQKINYY